MSKKAVNSINCAVQFDLKIERTSVQFYLLAAAADMVVTWQAKATEHFYRLSEPGRVENNENKTFKY